MEGLVAPSGLGKGFLDPMFEALIRFLREHDKESNRKLKEYSILYKKKENARERPQRPTDAAILVPEPDMTNPALIQLLQDAESEGNCSLYTPIPEIDLLDQCCGSHTKVTKVIRLNFDTKRYGAQRATPDGVSGNPFMRWKFNFSCVEKKAQSFFKSSLSDGTVGRIGFCYVPKPTRKMGIPRQGDYDQNYLDKLEGYLARIRCAKGEIEVPRLGKLIKKLQSELEDISTLSDNDTFEGWAHRALIIGWIKGCILYIAEGYKCSREILNFVEWSIYSDLWSKVALFAPQMKESIAVTSSAVRKYGPANMLDMLPKAFTEEQLETIRTNLDKNPYSRPQLNAWIERGYITFDPATKLYTKTVEYLNTHPQHD